MRDNIHGLNSYNPRRNEKYRILLTPAMNVIKSGNHSAEAVKHIMDVIKEEIDKDEIID